MDFTSKCLPIVTIYTPQKKVLKYIYSFKHVFLIMYFQTI